MDTLIFKTSGLRGRSNLIINPDIALRIGKAFAFWIRENYRSNDYYIYIAYDNRRNSKIIADTINAAMISSGINTIRFEEPIPTPLLLHAVVNNESHGGIMITGSHLPATDNGIILFDQIGNYYKGILEEKEFQYPDWSEIGKSAVATSEMHEYKLFLINIAKKLGIQKTQMKILIDPVHGPMKNYIELAVKQITDNIEFINQEFDDTFPGRNSEPTPESILPSRKIMLQRKCDLALATDMDGDRVLFISKSGTIITGDYLGAILANIFWKENPSLPIIAPINTSNVIEIAAQKSNGKVQYCHVGPPSIILAIRESNAKFGFEETGKYMFSDIGIWPDSAVTTLYLISLLQKTNKSLDDFLNEYPKLYSVKEKIASPQELGAKLVDLLVSNWNNSMNTLASYVQALIDKYNLRFDLSLYKDVSHLQIHSINDMDGIRINLSNNSYLMIRPSGTENYIRVFCEYPDKIIVGNLSGLGISLVNNLLNALIN